MRKPIKWGLGALALLCAFGLGRGDNVYNEADLLQAKEDAYNSGYSTGLDEGTGAQTFNQEAFYNDAFYQGQLSGYDLGYNEGMAQSAAQQQTVLAEAGDTYQKGYDLGYAEGYAQKVKAELEERDRYVASLQAALDKLQKEQAAAAEPVTPLPVETPPSGITAPAVTPAPEAPADPPLTTIEASVSPPANVPDDTSQIVYVTKSGTKYHRESCTHLSKSKIQKTLTEAKAAGYGPCKTCKPPQ